MRLSREPRIPHTDEERAARQPRYSTQEYTEEDLRQYFLDEDQLQEDQNTACAEDFYRRREIDTELHRKYNPMLREAMGTDDDRFHLQ